MPELPFPISAKNLNEALRQMQALMDELYQERIAGALTGDVISIDNETDVLTLDLATSSGLTKTGNELGLLVDPAGPVTLTAAGINVAAATTAKAGLVGILPNDATRYWNGVGTYTVPGATNSADTQIIFNKADALFGDANLTWDYTNKIFNLDGKLTMTKTPGSGSGSAFNLLLGTSDSPLTSADTPIYIDHHNNNSSGASYAIYIKTTGLYQDCGSGFVVENFGNSDGATFACTSEAVGACALAAFQNNVADVEQYVLTCLNTHGRMIMTQSRGTGETVYILRNANVSGTTKSGAHFFINENVGDYGHLIALRADAYSGAVDSDAQILFKKGTTIKFKVSVDGSIGIANNTAIWMNDSGGTNRNVMYVGTDTSPSTLVLGHDTAATLIYSPCYIQTLNGVLKTSSGLVSGSATIDDIGDGSTYKKSHNDFSDTYKGYLNQAVTSSSSPTFASPTVTTLKVSGSQVVAARYVNAGLANTPNSGDADTDTLIARIRDCLLWHGLAAAS